MSGKGFSDDVGCVVAHGGSDRQNVVFFMVDLEGYGIGECCLHLFGGFIASIRGRKGLVALLSTVDFFYSIFYIYFPSNLIHLIWSHHESNGTHVLQAHLHSHAVISTNAQIQYSTCILHNNRALNECTASLIGPG